MSPGRTAVCLLLAALGVVGCTSRTLPLPPPVVDRVSAPSADGFVTVQGFALEAASIGVVNDRTLVGVIATSSEVDCGSGCAFEVQISAQAGDALRVWQFFETQGAKEVVVPRARD